MWATMIHYMNDAQELQYALQLAREIVAEEVQSSVPDAESVVRVCDEFFSIIKYSSVFAISFSTHKDLLSQWRAYCPPEGGYAIGFDRRLLESIAQADGFRLAQCIYDRDAQRMMLRPVVREIITAAADLPADSHGLDFYLHSELHRRLAVQITNVGALLKHPSFREEDEWRLISEEGHGSSSVSHRTTGSLIVPYYELSIVKDSRLPISFIVIGPNRHPDLAGRALRSLANTTRNWPVKVEHSESPFRVLR